MTARLQTAFSAGVLAPSLHGRTDQGIYDLGLAEGLNVICLVQGGAINRAGTLFVGEVDDSTKEHRLIPFLRDQDERFVLVLGDETMEVVDGTSFIESSPGTRFSTSTPYAPENLPAVRYAQSIDVMFLVARGVPQQILTRTGYAAYSMDYFDVAPPAVPPQFSFTPSNNDGVFIRYAMTAVMSEAAGYLTATESNPRLHGLTNGPNLAIANRSVTLTIPAVADAESYILYKQKSGVYGYIGQIAAAGDFVDNNIDPDITRPPGAAHALLDTDGEAPAAVTLSQQRLCYGGGQETPEQFLASRPGVFQNFSRSFVASFGTDRMQFDIQGPEINSIQHMATLNDIIVFTSTGEHIVTGPDGALDATNPIVRQVGFSGIGDVPPLGVSNGLLFVTASGRSVREMYYNASTVTVESSDVSIRAPHYFRTRKAKEWAFARNPHNVAWVVMDDGSVLSLTYQREQEVQAWTEHDFGGIVESVSVVPDDDFDRVYFIVQRSVGGVTKRFVEMMARRDDTQTSVSDGFFLDCAAVYEGEAVTGIGGLDHLEGETVDVFGIDESGDPVDLTGLTVTSGTVTVSPALTKAVVGLPYVSRIETLAPQFVSESSGNLRGKKQRFSQAYTHLESSRGVTIGARDDVRIDIDTLDMDESGGLFTGMAHTNLGSGWGRQGGVVIEQSRPYAMHVIGVNPVMDLG